VYEGDRSSYNSLQNVLNVHSEDLHALAGNFTGTLTLGYEGAAKGGNTRINTPINLGGKTVTGFLLFAPETVSVNQPITMGAVGASLTVRQSLDLRGREIDLNANMSGVGELLIRPASNNWQPVNPLVRGMLVGATANDANRLTLTEAEYERIGTGFGKIVFGRGEMTGHLEVAGFASRPGFQLKADTELIANSTVKLNVNTGGTLANDGALKRLWVKSLELDITKPVGDLSMLAVNTVSASADNPRKIVVNRVSGAVPANAMDVNASDLAFIKDTVKQLTIGFTDSSSPNSPSAIDVLNRWTLPTATELRSTESDITVKGSIEGAKVLTLNTPATTRLEGSLRTVAPLASFSITKATDIAGIVQKTVVGSLGGPAVTVRTTGDQTFSESVELLSGGTLEAGGTLTVSQTLAAGANDLALLANEMLLNGGAGGITGTRGLRLGAGTAAMNMTFNGITSVAGQLALTQSKLQAIDLAGFSKLTLGRADGTGTLSVEENFGLLQETLIQTGGGALTIDKQINGAQKLTLSSGSGAIDAKAALGATTALGDLSVLSTGTATLRGAVNAASLFTDAGGATTLNGGAVTTTSLQDYNDQVVLGAATTLTSSGAGDININARATGPFALRINTSGVTRLKSTVTVASVKTNAGGSVELGASITTTGTQQYHEQAVLSGDTQLSGTTVTFDEALAGGGFGLLVAADAQFAKALMSLRTLEVTGNTSLNGGLVSTSGTQTYGGSVTLGEDTTLTSTALGDIALNGGATGGFALNINTSGTTRLAGTINLGGITTDAGGTVELPGLVATSGAQTYNDAAVLAEATTLASTGAGAVALNGGASGADDLTINTAGATTLGGGISVGSVTTDAGGTVKLSGDIQTTGTQSYGEAAQLVGNTTLSGTAVSFADTLGGGSKSLAVTGNAALNGAATGLSTFSVSGTTALNGGTVTTSGTQTYTGAVTLGSDAALTGSTVSFGNTLAGGSKSLAVTGNAEMNGTATGLSTLSVSGTTALNGGTVTTTGTQTYAGAVTLGSDAVLTGSTVSFGNTVAGGSHSLAVTGNAELNGAVSGLSTLGVTGTALLNTSAVETSDGQTFGGKVTIAQDAVLTSTGSGDVTINAGATGGKALAINTSGVTELGGGISVGSIATDAGGTVKLSGDIQSTGAQSYGEAAQLVGNTTLSGGTVSFGNTVEGGSHSLGVAGNAELNGAVSGLDTLGVTGTTLLKTSAVTTSGAQTYGGKVTLAQDAVLTSTGSGDVTVNSGATGDKTLAINTDGVTELGGGISVGSITTDAGGTVKLSGDIETTGTQSYGEAAQLVGNTTLSGGTVSFGNTVEGGSNSLGVTGNAELNGAVSGLSTLRVTGTTLLNTSGVNTSGAQTYGGKVTLVQDAVLASTGSGDVTMNSGSTGGKTLAINTSGVTELGGGISVSSIATDAGGTVKLSGDIQTTGTQSYGEAAQLVGTTTLSGGTVSFGNAVVGGSKSLGVTGNAEFNGAVSGLSTLGVTGTTLLNTSGVNTSGAQTYGGKVTLVQDAVLVSTGSGDVTMNAGATGDKTLAINTGGVTKLGGGISVGSITTDAGGTVELAGEITTSGAQTYNDAAVLTGSTTLASTGGGAVVLGNGLNGGFDLSVNTAGVTQLGGGVNVGSITTDAAGSVGLSGAITTTGAQTYNDEATLVVATTLSSTGGGALALKGGAAGAFDLAFNTSGATQLAGGLKAASLSTDAGGATEIAGDVTTSGAQTYGDAVQVSGPVALSSTSGGALTLGAGVDGTGSVSLATSGNVTVTGDSGTSGALQGFSATGARVEVGGVQASGDVTLDASDLLVLQGASYKAGDILSLNPTERAPASGRSSIVKPSGDVAFEAVEFVMGAGQKLVVSNGALSITAASGVAGDLAASVAMDLNVAQLDVVARDAGDFTNAGLNDLGLSVVSPKITFNGKLAYSPDSTGAKKVVWNTANGAVSGKNNITNLPGSGVGKNAKMSEQFNSLDAEGYVLQPLAVKPPVIPPIVVDPGVLPPVIPEVPVPLQQVFVRPVQFDLMNWSLGYRDETMERPEGIWVIRTLGINGRWDTLQQILVGEGRGPKAFAELLEPTADDVGR
jgi:hypothetical protein